MASDGGSLIDLIVDIAGEEAAKTAIERFGGSRVSVPMFSVHHDNWLVEIVGEDTAMEIFRAFNGPGLFRESGGGTMVELPLVERASQEKLRREVYRRLRLGQPIDRIAREVGVHRRTVQRHRAALKKIARQNAASRTEGPSTC